MGNQLRIFISLCAVTFLFAGFYNVQFELADFSVVGVEEDEAFCEAALFNDNNNVKSILMASTYFGEDYFEEGEKNCSARCTVLPPKCRKFKNVLNNVDAVVLHAFRADLIPALRDLKNVKHRKLNQAWIFLSLETPLTLERLSGGFRWSKLNGVFNWSASYRHDSDIFIPPVQFDGFEEIKPVTYSKLNASRTFTSSPRRHIAAVVSNCKDHSGRMKVLKDLASFGLTVDIYGYCSPNGLRCESHDLRECLAQFNGQYYFYASFENSLCRDYVTEKFYWALDFDLLPVVLGGINYTKEIAAKSFIDASTFSSSFDLAKYLLKVVSDRQLYESFFEWKQRYRIRSNPDNLPFCSICRKLHRQKNATPHQKSLDLDSWWLKGAQCKTDHGA